jgi:hypothetical protein
MRAERAERTPANSIRIVGHPWWAGLTAPVLPRGRRIGPYRPIASTLDDAHLDDTVDHGRIHRVAIIERIESATGQNCKMLVLKLLGWSST